MDYYTLGLREIAEKTGLTPPKAVAYVRFMKLQDDEKCYKQITIGNSKFNRYSPKSVECILSAVKKHPPEEVWDWYKKNH